MGRTLSAAILIACCQPALADQAIILTDIEKLAAIQLIASGLMNAPQMGRAAVMVLDKLNNSLTVTGQGPPPQEPEAKPKDENKSEDGK
jgi:hypothetical protein